ncbi:MAG: DNA mismatch repair endonuclease MutL [Clostridiales bacterium]|nr:DNA mismatch repair endonuclease MutL [Clostridiales bacterium]
MARIQVLDQGTINQIAAGEVIERPASVVKELLENAIDAKATAVTVEIRDGGISFIRVTDNGCGIPKEDLPLAFQRHSTSKIRSVEDLILVSSLGFRGEALSSIAAVAQVEVITRVPESITGSCYQIEGGKEISLEEIGAPEGTTFVARNLFYNTPVRRKFLKTAATEGAHVADLVEKIALSHPEVSIRFIQNNQNKLYTSGNHNLKDIVYTVFGREITAQLVPLSCEHEVVVVGGFIGKPVIARASRSFELYFINGCYIKSPVIFKAIEEAYRPFMMQHKYPFTMLQLRIEPEYLDVNVHPAKMELRFRDGETVFRVVRDAIAAALAGQELIPEAVPGKAERKEDTMQPEIAASVTGLEKAVLDTTQPSKPSSEKKPEKVIIPEPFEEKRRELLHMASAAGPAARPEPGWNADRKTDAPEPKTDYAAENTPCAGKEAVLRERMEDEYGKSEQLSLFSEKLLSPESRSRHRLIGQLFDTYWLVEFNDQLYIIDQHAAHEKVLYEKTMAAFKTRQHTSQMVEPPVILSLNAREEELLRNNLRYFTDIGFEIEHFGGREYALHGVPDNLFAIASRDLFLEMLDELADDIPAGNAELIYEKVASMSCKAAVKGNHAMSFAEADQLIDSLLGLENPYACPHGRPTIISMSKYELEKKFKRIV